MNSAIAVLTFASWVMSSYFLARYTYLAKWWRSAEGLMLFGFGVVIFAVSTLAVVSLVIGQDHHARPWARIVTWALTAILMATFCYVLERTNSREGRMTEPDDDLTEATCEPRVYDAEEDPHNGGADRHDLPTVEDARWE